jgi:hypothetical protein
MPEMRLKQVEPKLAARNEPLWQRIDGFVEENRNAKSTTKELAAAVDEARNTQLADWNALPDSSDSKK